MIGELRLLRTVFGQLLLQSVEERVEQRKNKRVMELSTALAYLDNPKFLDTTKDCILEYGSKNDCARYICNKKNYKIFLLDTN